jgi:hypothetical protein
VVEIAWKREGIEAEQMESSIKKKLAALEKLRGQLRRLSWHPNVVSILASLR